MAWRPVSNMVIIKNKVTNGVAWRPVSYWVSPKGVFDCSKSSKIAKKFFGGGNLVVWVNQVIKTILDLLIFFLQKNSTPTKTVTSKNKLTKQKQANKKQKRQRFFAHAKLKEMEFVCSRLVFFVLFVFFLHVESFHKKIKQV